MQNFHCVLDFALEKLGKAEFAALKEAQYEALISVVFIERIPCVYSLLDMGNR